MFRPSKFDQLHCNLIFGVRFPKIYVAHDKHSSRRKGKNFTCVNYPKRVCLGGPIAINSLRLMGRIMR